MQHKHAELIKAWADGAVIQAYRRSANDDQMHWQDINPENDGWSFSDIRIKPTPKPLGHVAKDAWYEEDARLGSNTERWEAAARAVIKAYKEQQ